MLDRGLWVSCGRIRLFGLWSRRFRNEGDSSSKPLDTIDGLMFVGKLNRFIVFFANASFACLLCGGLALVSPLNFATNGDGFTMLMLSIECRLLLRRSSWLPPDLRLRGTCRQESGGMPCPSSSPSSSLSTAS